MTSPDLHDLYQMLKFETRYEEYEKQADNSELKYSEELKRKIFGGRCWECYLKPDTMDNF